MRSVPGWGVVTSTAAPVLLIGGWTLTAALRPDHFTSVTDTISALAAIGAPNRWVMTVALVGVGAAHIGTALALRPAASAARCLLATGGTATVLVALNPLPGGSTPAPAHALAAGVSFIALAVWPAISWNRRRPALPSDEAPGGKADLEPVPASFRPVTALGASAVLLIGLGWFFAELAGRTDRVGLSERVAAGGQALWPLAAILQTRRAQRAWKTSP
ncbi:MAG TPA: DUF998 domain-containing protein [Kineosporiaceae bacterium]